MTDRQKDIRKLIAKFEETKSINNKNGNEPSPINETAQIEIICQNAMGLTMSVRQAAEHTGLSR